MKKQLIQLITTICVAGFTGNADAGFCTVTCLSNGKRVRVAMPSETTNPAALRSSNGTYCGFQHLFVRAYRADTTEVGDVAWVNGCKGVPRPPQPTAGVSDVCPGLSIWRYATGGRQDSTPDPSGRLRIHCTNVQEDRDSATSTSSSRSGDTAVE